MSLLLGLGCRAHRKHEIVDGYVERHDVTEVAAATVIFIPGVMGSELHDPADGRVYWGEMFGDSPTVVSDLDDFTKLALPLSNGRGVVPGSVGDDLEPGGQLFTVTARVGKSALLVRLYPAALEGVVQRILEPGDGRVRISKREAQGGRSPIANFGFDWRRSLHAEAIRLDRAVATQYRRRVAAGLDGRVDIVAHSQGAQLLRYYLRHGARRQPVETTLRRPSWAGARLVRHAVLVAPPTLGEVSVFVAMVEGEKISTFLPRLPPALLVSFPSSFELMPRVSDARVVWEGSQTDAVPLGVPVDIYDVALWERYSWGPFALDQDPYLEVLLPDAGTRVERLTALRQHMRLSLRHAQRMHEALDGPARLPDGLSMHVFLSEDIPTHSRIAIRRRDGAIIWLAPEPGDGMVSRASALGQTAQGQLLQDWRSVHITSGDHLGITADPNFLANVLFILFEDDAR